MKLLRVCIITLCLGIMGFGCWRIYSIQSGYRQGEQTYEALEAFVAAPTQAAPPSAQPETESRPEAPREEKTALDEPVEFPAVNFEALWDVNEDVIGWIYSKETPINYPIVQGKDNEYYLDHLVNGNLNTSGAIFLEYRNKPDFSDPNSIVFGHNMTNGTMFAGLTNYKEQYFYADHPQMLLMTPQKNYVVKIFAGAIMGEWDPVWKIDFADEEERAEWLADCIGRSRITTNITPKPDDRILTLSTCSYEYNGARFVVMGILQEA